MIVFFNSGPFRPEMPPGPVFHRIDTIPEVLPSPVLHPRSWLLAPRCSSFPWVTCISSRTFLTTRGK